jgi:hypothetical protein
LSGIEELGRLDDSKQFDVQIFEPKRFVKKGLERRQYLKDFDVQNLLSSIVFFDPDNGFETKTCKGNKWIRHYEVEETLRRLPENSVVAIYQHKPHRKWGVVLSELRDKCRYTSFFHAVYDRDLSFVFLYKNESLSKK